MPERVLLSPELRLLAACDMADDDILPARVAEIAGSAFDWDRFVKLATVHGLVAIVNTRLEIAAPRLLPRAHARALSEQALQNAAHHLLLTAETVAITRSLEECGIRAITLKGTALAHLLYAPHTAWRSSDDIDLLVREDDLPQAELVLVSRGYVRTYPQGELPRQGRDMLLYLVNAFTFDHPETGTRVELHHRWTLNPFWFPRTFESIESDTIEITTSMGPVRGLSGPILLAYLAWHALGHFGYRLKWFSDIARLLDRMTGQDRRVPLEACAEAGTAKPLALSCAVVDRLYADARPNRSGSYRGDASTDHVDRILSSLEAAEEMPTTRHLSGLAGELRYVRFMASLSPDSRARRYQALRAMTDPRDVATLHLGRRYTAAYAICGPFLAARRFLGSLAFG